MIHLFTHTDLDGVGCSVLAHIIARDNKEGVQPHYCDYSNIDSEVRKLIYGINKHRDFSSINETQFILITDISVNAETADKLEELCNHHSNIVLAMFDHHQLKPEIAGRVWVTNNTNYDVCGTSLLFAHMLPHLKTDAVIEFVNDVCLYDTWRFDKDSYELTHPEALNMLLYLMGHARFVDMALEWFTDHPDKPMNVMEDDRYYPFIASDIRKRNEYAGLCNDEMKCISYKGYNVGIIFAEKYISFVGDYVLKKNPSVDFVAIVNLPKSVSLRTRRTTINLGVDIARPLGGGGHPMAAGFQLKELPEDMVRKILGWEE